MTFIQSRLYAPDYREFIRKAMGFLIFLLLLIMFILNAVLTYQVNQKQEIGLLSCIEFMDDLEASETFNEL